MSTQHANVVTMLCNQPEAFASDLGDDQSRYLYNNNLLKPVSTSLAISVLQTVVLYKMQ